MGAIHDVATTLLSLVEGCVVDCGVYKRRFTYIGRPVIDCDTIAVSIGGSRVVSVAGNCQIHSSDFTIVIARCCWPTVKEDGSPPTPEEINTAVQCVMDDVESVLCCLADISLEGVGIVGRCKPKVTGTKVNNPTGSCASFDINLTVQTKVCCG